MILHVDMDAFFASVEQLDNPELRGKPVIVGGVSGRGVVCAASYEARKFGVHSAMPVFQAKRKCPEGIFIPPRRDRYSELSRKIFEIFREYTPLVEPVSIDEAWLDVTRSKRLFGDPEKIAGEIKERVFREFELTCSVGVAPNKILAKIASDMDKPDGLTVISPDLVERFIDTLPVGKVPGVGKVTAQKLQSAGIQTLGDVKLFSEKALRNRIGKFGGRLFEIAHATLKDSVNPGSPARSVSCEETLKENTDDREFLKNRLLKQSGRVARDLRKKGVKAKTITLKLKHSDFKQVTRSQTVQKPIRASKDIFREASMLLDEYEFTKKIRLIGVGASHLVPETIPVQRGLFEQEESDSEKWEHIDSAMDRIMAKFGRDAITRAAERKNPKTPEAGKGD